MKAAGSHRYRLTDTVVEDKVESWAVEGGVVPWYVVVVGKPPQTYTQVAVGARTVSYAWAVHTALPTWAMVGSGRASQVYTAAAGTSARWCAWEADAGRVRCV